MIVSARMQEFANLLIHSMLLLWSVHPGLHDAHFEPPLMVQAAPVCATPFVHVHALTTQTQAKVSAP